MNVRSMRIAAALTMAVAFAASAATPQQRGEYRAALKAAAAGYNGAIRACPAKRGSERSICVAEAKAARKHDELDAKAKFVDTPQARVDARVGEAKADYALARAKCGAKGDAERRDCIGAARAVEQEAIAQAMRTRR